MAQKNLHINIRIGLRQVRAAVGSLGRRFNLLRSSLRAVFRTGVVAGFFAALRSGVGVVNNLQNMIKSLGAEFLQLRLKATETAAIVTKGGMGFAAAFEGALNMSRDLSTQIGFAAKEIQEGMVTAARSGLQLQDSLRVTDAAMQLATAHGEQFQTTLNNLIGVTRAFGIELSEIPVFADALTTAVTESNVSLSGLFEGLKNVASIAATAFGETRETIVDTTAALMTLNDAGIQGCCDIKTEVLTKGGWRTWEDVDKRTLFGTVNQKTHNLEYQKSLKLFKYFYKGKMYRVKNRSIDKKVTPNHNMYIKLRGQDNFKIIQAKDIFGKCVKYLRAVNWVGRSPEFIKIPGFSLRNISKPELKIKTKVFVEFLGYYLSEGHSDYYGGSYRIIITQNPGQKADKIEACLKQLPLHYRREDHPDGSYKFIILDKRLYDYLRPLGNCYNKYIPDAIKALSKKYLFILYDSSVLGDGDCNGSLYTASEKLRDDYQEIILKLGMATNYSKSSSRGDTWNIQGRTGKCLADTWKINANKTNLQPQFYCKDYVGAHAKRFPNEKADCYERWEDYEGYVYCAEVPNSTLILRRNGKVVVSGNSKAGVRLRAAFQKLLGGTAKTTAAFTKYGVNLFQANAESQKFLSTLTKGQRAMADSEEELNRLKNKQFELVIAGKDNIDQMQRLAKTVEGLKFKESELNGILRSNKREMRNLSVAGKENTSRFRKLVKVTKGGSKELVKLSRSVLAAESSVETLSTPFTKIQGDIDGVTGKLSTLENGVDNVFRQFTLAGGKLKPFSNILREIGGKAPPEVIGRAFGIRGGEAIMRLLKDVNKFEKFKRSIEGYVAASQRGQSITTDMYAKFLDTVLVGWLRIKNTAMAILGDIADGFFEAIKPLIGPIQGVLDDIFRGIRANKDSFKQIFVGVLEVIQPALVFLQAWAQQFGNAMSDVFTPGKTARLPMIKTGEDGGLILDTKEVSGSVGDKIRGLFESLGSAITEPLGAALRKLSPDFIFLAEVFTDALESSFRAKAKLWESIGVLIAGSMIKAFAVGIGKELPSILRGLGDLIKNLGLPKEIPLGLGLKIPLPTSKGLGVAANMLEGKTEKPDDLKLGALSGFGLLGAGLDLFLSSIKRVKEPIKKSVETSAAEVKKGEPFVNRWKGAEETVKKVEQVGKAFVDFGDGLKEINLDALQNTGQLMDKVGNEITKTGQSVERSFIKTHNNVVSNRRKIEAVERRLFQMNSKGKK